MPIEHSDIGLAEIHLLHNWEYANAAARTGATGFVASDVGKWAKQLDDGSFWELTATTPTWAQRTGAGSLADDSVTNAKLANMAQATIKGRASGAGTGDPTDLTATQATAILDAVVGDSGSGGTKGLVPAPGAGDAAAGKFLKADGSFAVPAGSGVGGSTGSTDNAVLRADGTGGATAQSSAVSIDDNGAITVPEIAAPSTPAAGKVVIYAKSDNKVYRKGEDGVEAELGGGGGAVNPTSTVIPYNNAGTFADSPLKRLSADVVGRNGSDVLQLQAGSHIYINSANGSHGWHVRSDNGLLESNGAQGIGAGGRIAGLELLAANGSHSSHPTSTSTAFIGWSSGPLIYNVNGFVSLPNVALPDWPTATSVGTPSNNLDNGTGRYMQRLVSSGAGTVTGMSTGAGTAGVSYLFINTNASDTITIAHESASSTAANRFRCSTGADIVLSAGQAADVIYDTSISRWRVFKRN